MFIRIFLQCFIIIILNQIVSALNTTKLIEKFEYRYLPTWESLDTRPLPKWYDEAKVGIFLHWGVFSVPSFGSEWFWANWKDGNQNFTDFVKNNYPPNFSYQDFAKDFTAEFFDPDEWANLFRLSGAKYVVLTSKHHEGFTLWPSRYSFSWNAHDVGPHRDLIGDLSKAVRQAGLTFGLYHSLYEWYNPIYLADKTSKFQTRNFVENKILPEMYELVNNYQPEVIWSDGDWEAQDNYWASTKFLAWLYNDSPVKSTVVVNDRWGSGIPCKHGDFYTCQDRYDPGKLQNHKWENAMTIDKKSWGFRRNAKLNEYLTIEELIALMVRTVSCGGNILINVGPTKEGTIAPIFQDRLLDLGKWLSLNGEAIYGTVPWKTQNDTLIQDVWYTLKNTGNILYATVLSWPKNNELFLYSATKFFYGYNVQVILLGHPDKLAWNLVDGKKIRIQFPDKATITGQWAWVLKIMIAE